MNRFRELERSVQRTAKGRSPKSFGALLSEGLFDTGEHVLTGTDSSEPGPLNPSETFSINGVQFTYGEIIAMADLYESFDQMSAAPRQELRNLKRLIDQSMRYYRRNLSVPHRRRTRPAEIDWADATGERYGDLALANYAHFAPSDAMLVAASNSGRRRGNNKAMWRSYHAKALDAVRAGVDSNALDRALATNAFGDHFLTDAFAGGHLFNKQDVAAKFKALAYSGNDLNDRGEAMIEKVAEIAWRFPQVRSQFGRYEIVLDWLPNPNLDALWVFKRFLKGVAEDEPEVVTAGLIAKVIHDNLNQQLVPVQNALNEQWSVTGDEYLDPTSLPHILKAVAQSVANVSDVAANPNINNDQAFAKVWRHVPRPTRASANMIKRVINKYTNPSDHDLRQRSAEVVKGYTKMIIEAAKTEGAIKLH